MSDGPVIILGASPVRLGFALGLARFRGPSVVLEKPSSVFSQRRVLTSMKPQGPHRNSCE